MASSMQNLRIVMVRTRFPENIGMAARAASNFGHPPLFLVDPERWDRDQAQPLATSQGSSALDEISVTATLAEAVAPCTLVVGTTARTGGWRRELCTPRQAAMEVAQHLLAGEKVALVFGPEDRGLHNSDLEHCGRLVTVPTAPDASSLNVAQAILLLVYECFLALPNVPKVDSTSLSRRINREERDLLNTSLKRALTDIDVLRADNPDYFYLPLSRFLDRADVRRHEMDMLMGMCRQITRITGVSAGKSAEETAGDSSTNES